MLICVVPPQVLLDADLCEKVFSTLSSHGLDPDPNDYRDVWLTETLKRKLIELMPDQPIPPVQFRGEYRMIRLRCESRGAWHFLCDALASGIEGSGMVKRYRGGTYQPFSATDPHRNAHLRELLIVPKGGEQMAFIDSCFPVPQSRLAA